MPHRSRSGFTVIEVAVAVLCVLVLMWIVFATSKVSQEAAQLAQCQGNMGIIAGAYTSYLADNDGYIPPNQDYQNFPDYQPATAMSGVPGGTPPYMTRSPTALLQGPNTGPWYFAEKVAPYLPDQNVWICKAWVKEDGWFGGKGFWAGAPYHPTIYTCFVQMGFAGLGEDPAKRVEDLGGAPSDVFLMGHGTSAMLSGSGTYDDIHNLAPALCDSAFIHSLSTVHDAVVQKQGDKLTTYTMGLRGMMFADMHVAMMRYREVWNGTRDQSWLGAGDGKYYLSKPVTEGVEQP